ncbi:MAG: hypothetical protein LQ352_001634 [Teloschistes flavicans]|nr:MAG: hypothetical protein LQ352_001634 [Teloschistes flavicans]
MADMSAEEAFLKSMKDMADAEAVQYETKTADGKQTDSTSSDEYDPAQAVPDTFSPPPAQDLPSSPGAVKQTPSLQILDHSNVAATGLQDHAADDDDDDGRSQSRSMSDSSSSSASPVTIQTNNVPFKMDGPAESATQQTNNLQTSRSSAEGAVQSSQSSALRSPSSAANGVASHVQSHNDVSLPKLPDADQTGLAQSVPQSNASLPDNGREALPEPTTETATPAPAPQASDTKTSAKNETQAASSVALPKARLPQDKIGILEDRIQEDPRGDMDAWLELISKYREQTKIQDARATYERFFTVFPAAAEQWIAYAKMEADLGNMSNVERIFQRILFSLPNLHLWSTYLSHVRRLNDINTDPSGHKRQVVTQAFELVLDHIGMDKDSGYIWQDYIQLLKSKPGNVGGSTWQEQQKMDQLRKAYQRAIKVPTQATQALWKEYDQFEMSINKLTGRKFLQEESPAYMTARSSYIALSNITRNLRRTTLPVLPPALGFDGDREYGEQLDIWKQWIQWEKDDPLVLKDGKDEEKRQWRERVVFVYKQAVMDMRFWPELWFDAAQFCFENDMDAVGKEFLVQGINANPESCLLAFRLADRVELTSSNEEGEDGIARRGAAVREPYEKVLDALYELIKKTTDRESQNMAKIEAQFATETETQLNSNDDDDDNYNRDEVDSKEKRKAVQVEAVKGVSAMQVRLLSKMITSVWTALMRAMRRVQGKGKVGDKIGGARQIFTDARKRGRLTQDIYVASAMIEYHCYEPEATKKIFERGLKLFPEDEQFALEYIKHLMLTNDAINARVVFETVVNRLTAKPETLPRAKPLYAFFHDFESKYGELAQISKLEKRMKDHFPDDPTLSHFSRRYVHQGFDPTAIRPIISPATQTRPRFLQPNDSTIPPQASPLSRTAQTNNSPKRSLPFDDSDNETERPRKLARGESPLKGAAGRRLEQQKRSQPLQGAPQFDHALPPPPPPPQPLPPQITDLLSVLPRRAYYPNIPRFLPGPAVDVIASVSLQNPRRAQEVINPQQRAPLPMPPRPPQAPPPVLPGSPYGMPQAMPPMPPNGMPNPYSGGYSSVPPNFPSSSFPQQHQLPASSGGPHFQGPNGQMMGHGGAVQGPSYSYGAPGQYNPYNR